MDTQVYAEKVLPQDRPPPFQTVSLATTAPMTLFPHSQCLLSCALNCKGKPSTSDVLQAIHFGSTISVPEQHPKAFGQLQVSATTVAVPDKIQILVQNLTSANIFVPASTTIAKAQLLTEARPAVPIPLSDDIRLRPVYLDYIAKRTQWPVHHFQQLFYNQGDFVLDDWSQVQKAWINPPWPFLQDAVNKLIQQTPQQWVFILPKYKDQPAWYQQLHSADHIQCFTLPRTLATGYFTRFRNDLPEEDLPFPVWEVEVVIGTFASFTMQPSIPQNNLLTHDLDQMKHSWHSEVVLPAQFEHLRQQLLETLTPFQEYIDGSKLGLTTAASCPIHLMDDTPFNVPQYRLSRVQQHVVDEEVNKLLKLGVIEPSESPWNSPILVIPKKDGSLRFCADLRKLNSRAIKDVFPLPNLQDTLDALGQSNYFTTLDLKSGYWQLPIPPEDRPKTALSTSKNHYQWCRAPFGYCNISSIFQRMMIKLLLPCTKFTLVYLDDIIIFSDNLDDHFKH
ncbi:MAG: reverse transcriptase family protein, partial [Terriglobales bacterium]